MKGLVLSPKNFINPQELQTHSPSTLFIRSDCSGGMDKNENAIYTHGYDLYDIVSLSGTGNSAAGVIINVMAKEVTVLLPDNQIKSVPINGGQLVRPFSP